MYNDATIRNSKHQYVKQIVTKRICLHSPILSLFGLLKGINTEEVIISPSVIVGHFENFHLHLCWVGGVGGGGPSPPVLHHKVMQQI